MDTRSDRDRTTKVIAQAAAVVAVLGTITAVVIFASEIVLTLFLGILFGVFLTRVSTLIAGRTPLSSTQSLAVVVAALIASTAAAGWLGFAQLDRQINQISDQIGEGTQRLSEVADRYPAVRSVVSSIPFVSDAIESEGGEKPNAKKNDKKQDDDRESAGQSGSIPQPIRRAATVIGQIFRTTFGLVVNSILIFFVGLFLALSPTTYRDGVVRLVPPARRERAKGVLDDIGQTLWKWLLGRFGSMAVTGVGAFVLLALIGVPMAGTLGVLTGLLTFVPNIGAAIALMLALLLALPQGTSTALMVLPAYLLLQIVESYVVTPLIQQKQVSLPPALLIAFQALMGVLFGFLGAAVASPLLAAAKVAIEELYIEELLEDGESESTSGEEA